MTALLSFWPLFRQHVGRMGLALTLSVLTLAAGVALLWVSGWFLTAAALTTAAASFNLFGPSSLIRGLSLVRILSRYGERLVGHDATLRLLSALRGWLFARLFPRIPLPSRDLRHGDLVSRLTADVDTLDTVFLTAFGPILTALLIGTAMTAGLFVLLPAAAPIYATAIILALAGVPAVLILFSHRLGADLVEASAALRIAMLDRIDGHADLVAFGAVAAARQEFEAAARRLARARRRSARAGLAAAAAVQLLAGLALVGVLWCGIDALGRAEIGGPLLVGLLLAVLASFEATAMLVRSVAKFGAALAAAERVRAIAQMAPAINDPQRPVTLPGGTLAVNRVTFGFDPARPVLRDLSLTIAAGERVAIVGESGSGKSTLLALLLRLHDPQAGSIAMGGTDIRTVRQADLHARIALLSQSSPVFLGSVRDNLLIGRPEASDAELWSALEAARIADFIRSLPEGLDAFVGEAGRTLSVGQARRLCLARVLLSPAEILVFDEPTTGLDRTMEADFLADLAVAAKGRSVILATHAEIPAGACDRVLTLADGRLVPMSLAGG
ncbi:thiol reductant ABC exporter subunit CydC [Labrys okinawensis]|uniref:Thiol reductant ABC exporter subunit CydC n=1 Tax=Labrys okinawensis TaxID=346911 RepID=A0A2S9QBS6_9HYPH|nr:thiol reductant ABC exporter subunit CydC [Labrys okinawensis]PRH86803.1 thiol reductant ABC exporter subunit CydC [Labrys okinawensis]